MNKSLHRRLLRLETERHVNLDAPRSIFVCFAKPRDSCTVAEHSGRRWMRRTNETEEAFKDRVISEVEWKGLPSLILLFTAEQCAPCHQTRI